MPEAAAMRGAEAQRRVDLADHGEGLLCVAHLPAGAGVAALGRWLTATRGPSVGPSVPMLAVAGLNEDSCSVVRQRFTGRGSEGI